MPTLIDAFVHWMWLRAALHRGWWLVASVYMVVDAGLSASQLVLIGAAQGLFALVSEVPAGVLADTVSRKWSLVLSQLLMGTAMLATGLVTSFPLLLATQVLWGLSWTFASGSDIAWVTDELDRPDLITLVLSRAARAERLGAAVGLVGLGALAWATHRSTALVLAGVAMALLSVYVVTRFTEERFVPVGRVRWSTSWTIFRSGLTLVHQSPEIRRIFLATFLLNGAASAGGRLAPLQVLSLGLPVTWDPIVWFTAVGVVALVAGAAALRIAQKRLDGAHARHSYRVAATVGFVGMTVFAFAPNAVIATVAFVVVSGIAVPLTWLIAGIWVNARTTSAVRATTLSFLSQADYLGGLTTGLTIALLAASLTLPVALAGTATLFALTAALMRPPAKSE
jgi:MFS family permease